MKTLEKFYNEKEINKAVDSFDNEWILSYPIHEASILAKTWKSVDYLYFSGIEPKRYAAREATLILLRRVEELL